MSDHAYVVESPVTGSDPKMANGTARVYVDSEARAIEIASGHPERTYRKIPLSEMPDKARDNLLRARNEAARG